MTSSCPDSTSSQTAITNKELIVNSSATTMAAEGKRLVPRLIKQFILNLFDNDDDDGLVVGFVIVFPRLSYCYECYRTERRTHKFEALV
jgi:hypothetical protein